MGEIIRVVDPVRGTDVKAQVISTHFFDPEGVRLRA